MQDFDFIAFDVETANENYWSICQVGFAYFKDGVVVNTWESLVNPETYFSSINTSIHGITEKDVKKSIKLAEAYSIMGQRLTGNLIAHHTHFDRSACYRCSSHTRKEKIKCQWIDTAIVARRSWQSISRSGYGLVELAAMLDIPVEHHHNALSDAKTAGLILLHAQRTSGLPIKEFSAQFTRTLNESGELSKLSKKSGNATRLRNLANSEPNPDGIMFGEVIVFTGALQIPRLEAAQMAYELGCNVDLGVNKDTTILVVGRQDIERLAGHEKSTKHRKAEELISKGQNIRIMSEDDFKAVFEGW